MTGLNHDGAGVGRLDDGRVVFVPKVLPGETARVQLVARRKGHWIGRLIERTSASALRRQEPCILADHCGGCTLQHLEYGAQCSSKHEQLSSALQRIGQVALQPDPVMTSALELGYRNKAIIPLERCGDGRLRAGYYRRGSHQIVNMNHCLVLDPRLDRLIEPLKSDLEATGWPIDKDLCAAGGLRHLALRLGHHTGELLITLISSHDQLPGLEALASAWMQRWPQLIGVALNLQPQPGNRLFGETTHVITGRGWLLERFCALELELASDTFFQVNTPQAERVVPLLRQALGAMPLQLVDAYCGVGTFSLPLAAEGHHVVGLELHGASVALAQRNAQRNGLASRCRFVEGPVAQLLAGELARGCDGVVVDPPRKGLEPEVLSALKQQPPATLLYLSCDPATLARDLGRLTQDHAFTIQRIIPLDFFPNTSHIETLAVLSS